jgi:hypothetical protein
VTTVRLRWSPSWHVTRGPACVAEAPGGWTTVVTFDPGAVKVVAQLSLDDSDQCTDAQLSDAGAARPDSHQGS